MKAIIFWFALTLAGCGSASNAGEGFVPTRSDGVHKTPAEWKALLTAEEYRILRGKGTERAFSGKYWQNKAAGTYHCAGCGLELFSSADKFRSGTGWPSYTRPIAKDRVGEAVDASLGVKRTEILCNRCGGHLGHVFTDGPAPTGLRYCVNGNALDFHPKETQ